MNYGLTQMAQGKYAEAQGLFEQARLHTPNYAYLETNLGIVNDKLGAPVVAERHFQRALQLQPDFVEGHYFYARWLVDQGRAREAMPHLQRAVALSPGLPSARTLLMHLYFAQDAQAPLTALVQETLALAPDDPVAGAYARGELGIPVPAPGAPAYYALGLTLTQAGRHLEAALTYRRALQLDPTAAAAANNLGWSLAKLGLYHEAVPALVYNLVWVHTQLEPER
jgi:tetratricopeptide (TPR) repeat protein